jgi:hypothetical protein
MALANIASTNTFDEWRIRFNQDILRGNEFEITIPAAYTAANAVTSAYNTANVANATSISAYGLANTINTRVISANVVQIIPSIANITASNVYIALVEHQGDIELILSNVSVLQANVITLSTGGSGGSNGRIQLTGYFLGT